MDPISASTFNLSIQDAYTNQVAASCKSLSNYEKRNLKNLLPQIAAATIATCNHIVVGIGLAYSAILTPQLENKNSDIVASRNETSWLASVIALMAPIGAILSAYIMDRWGRINTLKFSALPSLLGWVLMAVAQNVETILIGRVISGIACCLATSPAAVYITEIARKDMRGSLLSLGPAFVSLGMVIAYLKGWLLDWRAVAWLCNIYIVIPLFLLFALPESPVWLISKGRYEEARKSLTWLHRYQPKPPNEEKTFAELQLHALIKEEEQKKFEAKTSEGTIFKEFLKPTGYKPLLIISGVFFFQQFSGIYIFLFYSVTFFEDVGTKFNPYIASILIGVIRLVMSLVNTGMLKYYNRRMLMMVSASGMAVCTLFSGFFTHWIKNGTTELNWPPVIFLLFYVIFSMVGMLPIPWTMTAELFPLKIRSTAHSLAISIVNVIMFFAVQNYTNMERGFGGSAGVQWFFSAVSLSTVIYIFVFLPETHRKKLVEIQEYFENNTVYIGAKKKEKGLAMAYEGCDQGYDKSEADDKLINSV